jgi:pantetheine-phosphate adenylyltransferase
MRIGIYPGSFDPLTNGHLDIAERAKSLCDRLIIAIAMNSAKHPLFSVQERLEFLHECCVCGSSSIEITSFEGLLVDYCREKGVTFIIRGLRAIVDFEYEFAIALLNKKLAPEIETIFLMSQSENSFISSNMVKEVASYGGDVTSLVPQFIHKKLREKYSSR